MTDLGGLVMEEELVISDGVWWLLFKGNGWWSAWPSLVRPICQLEYYTGRFATRQEVLNKITTIMKGVAA